MDFKFFSFLLILFCLIGFVSSWDICIDAQTPEAPTGFTVSGNVQLNWDIALDKPEPTPECFFGIDYYNVYLDDVWIAEASVTSYSGSVLADGTYVFEVSAVDKGGNEGSRASVQITFPLGSGNDNINNNNGGGSSGGGGGGSSPASPATYQLNQNNSNLSYSENENSDLLKIDNLTKEENKQTSFSGITGAIIGIGNFAVSGKGVILFIFLVGLLGCLIVFKKQKNKTKK